MLTNAWTTLQSSPLSYLLWQQHIGVWWGHSQWRVLFVLSLTHASSLILYHNAAMKGEVWLSSPTCNKSSCNMTVFSCRIDISIPLYQPKDFLQLPSFLGTVYMLPAASRMDIACPKYNVFHLSVWLTSFLTSCTVFKNRLGKKKKPTSSRRFPGGSKVNNPGCSLLLFGEQKIEPKMR